MQEAAHPEANIIFGAVIDDALGDEVRVTVIAAGFDGGAPARRRDDRALGQISGGRSPSTGGAPTVLRRTGRGRRSENEAHPGYAVATNGAGTGALGSLPAPERGAAPSYLVRRSDLLCSVAPRERPPAAAGRRALRSASGRSADGRRAGHPVLGAAGDLARPGTPGAAAEDGGPRGSADGIGVLRLVPGSTASTAGATSTPRASSDGTDAAPRSVDLTGERPVRAPSRSFPLDDDLDVPDFLK